MDMWLVDLKPHNETVRSTSGLLRVFSNVIYSETLELLQIVSEGTGTPQTSFTCYLVDLRDSFTVAIKPVK
jgi:hypothetical protein